MSRDLAPVPPRNAIAAHDGRFVADAFAVRARFLASTSGFSLAETLIALAILASAVLSLAQLFLVSGAVIRRARHVSTATILGAQKLEELRTLPIAEAEGRVEYLDRTGAFLSSSTQPADAAYVRRWSLRPHMADPDRIIVISVRVTPAGPSADRTAPDGMPRQAGEVVLVTMRAR
jgi:prepilin-type N-terminal cleavage/methylation domain-containing protein